MKLHWYHAPLSTRLSATVLTHHDSMEKARIRTGWKNTGRTITVEELANTVSSVCWRMSLNAARNLHQQDFVYSDDHQRLGVIREYLAFLVHCADRLMFEVLDQDQRQRFMEALVEDCRRHFRANAQELVGGEPGGGDFIQHLNARMSAYAGTRFDGRQPGYDMLRLLGSAVQDWMGSDQTNRWVIDQVMEIDGPEVFGVFLRSVDKLRRNAGFPDPS